MLVVETIAKIRRLHFVQGQTIKSICRDLGLSRKVVRKVLRSGATEFRYERTQQPLPKLGAWQSELDRLLFATDYPHWDSDDPRYAFKCRMSEAEHRAIFAGNAKAVYRL